MHNCTTILRRKPTVHEAVHTGKPIDPLPHERGLAVSDFRPISEIVSDHAGVVVEGPPAQSNRPSETRHDHGQSIASAIILSHPQPASMRNLAAKWRDRAIHNEAW